MLKFPDFMTMAQVGGKVFSLTHRPPLPPGNTLVIIFLEADYTPWPLWDRRDIMSMKYSNDTSWDRTSDLPICSTAP